MRDLNAFYSRRPALYQRDFTPDGFEWIDCNDSEGEHARVSAQGHSPDDLAIVVCNFTPVPRDNYRMGVPRGGQWRER
jgi:1,4-alpha-glucan branching enzyme